MATTATLDAAGVIELRSAGDPNTPNVLGYRQATGEGRWTDRLLYRGPAGTVTFEFTIRANYRLDTYATSPASWVTTILEGTGVSNGRQIHPVAASGLSLQRTISFPVVDGRSFDITCVHQANFQVAKVNSPAAPSFVRLRYESTMVLAAVRHSGGSVSFTLDSTRGLLRYYPHVAAAAVASFGVGCPAASPLSLTADGRPVPGTTSFSLGVAPVDSGWPTLLFLGASRTTYGGIRLPLDLSSVGFAGCELLVSPDSSSSVFGSSGQARFPLPLPPTPLLLGAEFFAQALQVTGPATLRMSDGARILVGHGF